MRRWATLARPSGFFEWPPSPFLWLLPFDIACYILIGSGGQLVALELAGDALGVPASGVCKPQNGRALRPFYGSSLMSEKSL